MATLREEANELNEHLKGLVTASVEELTEVGNRLQQLSNRAPGALSLCDFNAPQRMRRLLNIPAKAWGPLEVRWCHQAVQEIESLQQAKDSQAVLALACYGVFAKDLQKLIQEVAAEVSQTDETPEKPSKSGRKLAKKAPAPEGEDDLDAETLAALEALQAEAASLQA